MPSRSALARLQQGTTLSLLLVALAWLGWHWRDSPALAVAGAVFILFFFSLVLAIEFVTMRYVSGGDPAPRPTWAELGRAWFSETIAALRVFAWRQPFRWREVPDHLAAAPGQPARRGVVLVHGFVCNRGFWTPWMKELRARGHCFVAVNLEPVFGSIDDVRAHHRTSGRAGDPRDRHAAGARVPQHGRVGRPRVVVRREGRVARRPRDHDRLAPPRHLAGAIQPPEERHADEAARASGCGAWSSRKPRAAKRSSRAGTPTATTSCSPPPRPRCPAPTTGSCAAWRMWSLPSTRRSWAIHWP